MNPHIRRHARTAHIRTGRCGIVPISLAEGRTQSYWTMVQSDSIDGITRIDDAGIDGPGEPGHGVVSWFSGAA